MSTRALLASPLGFLIGISLGALGGGGSILAVPALVYAAGEDPKGATTTSLLVVGLASIGGMVSYLRAGQVRLGAGIAFGLAGVGGSLVGSQMNHAVDGDVLLLAFSVLMFAAAWRMWAGSSSRSGAEEEPEGPEGPAAGDVQLSGPAASSPGGGVRTATRLEITPALVAKVIVAGTFVGLMTGFFGVGGGFVIVPALVLVLDFEMPEAVGTSLLVIAMNSAVALLARLGTTGVEWGYAVPFTVAALLGVATGKRIADRVPTATLVRWFVGLLVAVAAYVAIRATLALT